ncbi:MAG: ATP-binding cassette domain-containing protein [Gammaproteobacteria bacterium]|nr:ATP-binding cassette domain-containing protein [Gammaproteobacteria bacterium]
MSSPAVELEAVVKAFANVTAVNGISASVPRGCVFGVLGPNGAGKTTTIRMVVGILRPDSGSVRVLGETEPGAIKRRLGYLPEEKGLYKKMRLLELVTYFGRLKGMGRADARAAGRRLLDQFGLAQWQDQKCESLSKGMGQKVQIVGTLIHSPELIVLDEPFSGLDPVNVELVRQIILEQKAANRTVILSTHVMEQAEQICDAIVLINRGRTLVEGPTAQVRQQTQRTVILDYDGDGAALSGLPGVLRVNDAGRHAELSLADDADPQQLLLALAAKLTIRRFDTRAASLHEVFVRSVRADDAL